MTGIHTLMACLNLYNVKILSDVQSVATLASVHVHTIPFLIRILFYF